MEIPPSKIEAAAAAPAWFILISTYNGEGYSFPSANYAKLVYGTLTQVLNAAEKIAEDESGCCCRGQCSCWPLVGKDTTRCLTATGGTPVLHISYTHTHGDGCEDQGSLQVYRYSPDVHGIKIIADTNDCEFLNQKCSEETHAAYAANTNEEEISDDGEDGFFYSGDEEEAHRLVNVSRLGAFEIIDTKLGDGYELNPIVNPQAVPAPKVEKKFWVILQPVKSVPNAFAIIGEGADENHAWSDALGSEWDACNDYFTINKLLRKCWKKGWESRQVTQAEYNEILNNK